MSIFADVERFAKEHASCGTLTPATSNATDTGYQLTVSCSCGAIHTRWVTTDETAQADAPSRGAPPQSANAARPVSSQTVVVPPGSDQSLEAAMKEALEALETPAAPPSAPPPSQPAAADSPSRPSTPPSAPAAKPGRRAPDKQALQSVLKATLEAFDSSPETSAEPTSRPRAHGQPRAQGKHGAGRDGTGKAASGKRRRGRGAVIALLMLLMLGVGAGGAWLVMGESEVANSSNAPGQRPRLHVPDEDRLVITRALGGLRDLQGVSTPDAQFRPYFNRVSFTKSDMDRWLQGAKDSEAKSALREAMALHVLAAAAWRAKTVTDTAQLEALGDDPGIELCPVAKRNLMLAEEPPTMNRKQWRALALAASVPLLWDCAAERITDVDRALR